jgi:dimethylglycine dehydrogenase
MVSPDHSAVGTKLEIVILGKRYKATIIPESPFDAENDRLRG